METKICKTCQKELSLSKFYRCGKYKEKIYYRNECKSCDLKKMKDYYLSTRDHQIKKANKYRKQKIAENPNWKKLKEMAYNTSKTFEEVETWFNKQWMKQQAQCAMCGKVFCDDDCIDHDHETNELRGLLCSTCNSGIGFLKDSADLCLKAYNYLIKNKIERK